MVLIDSLYINNSGGKVLLDELVASVEENNIKAYYIFDSRCEKDFSFIDTKRKTTLASGLKARKKFYTSLKEVPEIVFTFNNLPPPIRLKSKVYTYFHNVNLLAVPAGSGFKLALKLFLKRIYIWLHKKNTDFFVVQSDFVKEQLSEKLKVSPDRIKVLPFYRSLIINTQEQVFRKKESFVYISNGNPHKNHERLLMAWQILADKGMYPELHLTITEPYFSLMKQIDAMQSRGIKIFNHGYTNPLPLYQSCEYSIYPSISESFGLGLIEATLAGCNVVASDLPYVNAVIKPSAVFNPYSPESIADIIGIFMNTASVKKTEVVIKDERKSLLQLLR